MSATANRSDRSAEHVLRKAITTLTDCNDEQDPPCCADCTAEMIMRLRIPQACQTCKGSGVSHEPTTDQHLTLEPCSDCPTIGTLLLWGWNVAQAKPDIERQGDSRLFGYRVHDRFVWDSELLAALREVTT